MWTMLWRTAILYSLLILAVRLLGKRQIGQMEPSEFVVTMLLANLAAIPLEETDIPILHGIVSIALVFAGELLIAWLTTCSLFFRQVFCGKPEILIDNGKLCYKALKKNRVNLDELTMQLREKEIFDLSEVKFAILETNGQLSTMLYAKNRPADAKAAGIKVEDTELPITLISDGKLLRENLAVAKKTHLWVNKELAKRSCKQADVLLMTVDAAEKIHFVKRND